MKESLASVWKYSLTLFCFWGQNNASAYRGEGVKWRGGGGVVVALQNEFTEIFIYNFFEGFCWEENEFYPNISANVELCQVFYYKRHHESTPDAKIVSLVS